MCRPLFLQILLALYCLLFKPECALASPDSPNEDIQDIATAIYRNGGVVSAICHRAAGITGFPVQRAEST